MLARVADIERDNAALRLLVERELSENARLHAAVGAPADEC